MSELYVEELPRKSTMIEQWLLYTSWRRTQMHGNYQYGCMPLMLFFVVTAWCWNEPATSFIEINFDFHQVGRGSKLDYIRSRSTMQLRSMEYKFRQHLLQLHHNTSFNASSMSELKMRLASGLFIRNKMAFLAIDEPFGIRIMYKNDSFIVISLLRSPNESTHMMDKTWTGQLFA